MSAVEVAYEIRKVAAFMVATESFEPSRGWPYAAILDHLRRYDGSIAPREATRQIVQKAAPDFSLVGIELDWMSSVAETMTFSVKLADEPL